MLPPVTSTTRDTAVLRVVSAESAVLDAFTWSRYRALLGFAGQAYADTVSESQGQASSSRTGSTALITDARAPASAEMRSRVRRYTITMAFRTACFIAMVIVDGPMRWVLFGCAVILPYVAVVAANQVNQRTGNDRVSRAEPPDRPQLTTGPPEPEVVTGAIGDDDRNRRDRKVA